MSISEKIRSLSFSQAIVYIALFAVGSFHEYLSCLLALAMLVWLIVRWFRAKALTVNATPMLAAMGLLVLAYAVSALWAVDAGAAIFGFFKFLPLPLYLLVLMQEPDGREKAIAGLPLALTVMTVLSVVGMQIPALTDWFSVAGRLAGFLQYPNTFALLLLVAELLLLTKDHLKPIDYVCLALLLFGLLYTGSRTVLVLAVPANIAALFINKNKKIRQIALGAIGAGVVLVLLYCLVTDSFSVLGRYLNINWQESTFVGRLLYVADALPMIAKHPFGLGYMGYHYVQQSIQTGVYAVQFVHNDVVQILLDVGWLPCVTFVAAVVASLCSRKLSPRYKLALAVMLLHACFDFDLQYIAVFMVLLLLTAPTAKTTWVLTASRSVCTALATVLAVACVYAGTVLGLARFGQHEAVRAWYPWHTESDIAALQEAKEPAEIDAIADRILERNEYVALAYNAKARAAFSSGDFTAVIENANTALTMAPFAYESYCDYGYMLVNGIMLYEQAGDTESAAFCRKELLSLSRELLSQQQRLSEWGKAIDDQPTLVFPKDLATYVESMQQED